RKVVSKIINESFMRTPFMKLSAWAEKQIKVVL
ncbi:MAG: hypothetical protein RL563_388, partial [Pseudomonadota bacterium]